MTWLDALKAAIISIPKLLDAFERLGESIGAYLIAQQEEKKQGVRDAQNKLEIEILRVQHDEERARLTRRISELERKL